MLTKIELLKTPCVTDDNIFIAKYGNKKVTFDDLVQISKVTYCRYYSFLLFPSIACHNVLIDLLKHCERYEYSIVYIEHTETKTPHYHFIIGFTSSYNQKKSIYQVSKELGFFQYFSYELQNHFVNFLNHIEPIRNIKDSLLYLLHLSEGAKKDFKKPYSVKYVNYGINGNVTLISRLNEYVKDISSADEIKWNNCDVARYLYDICDKYTFTSQSQLQRFILSDYSITDNQKSKIFSQWRNFIFALQEFFKKSED